MLGVLRAVMITIPFTRSARCVRCKGDLPRRFPRSYLTITPTRWVQFKFRICEQCFDQIKNNVELKLEN
jgi:hypothetical protein